MCVARLRDHADNVHNLAFALLVAIRRHVLGNAVAPKLALDRGKELFGRDLTAAYLTVAALAFRRAVDARGRSARCPGSGLG